MKILITGGAGFIGANFCQYMLKNHPTYSYVCLDALTYASNLDNISNLFELDNFEFVHGNICDGALVDKLFKKHKFDIVINFAAESHVDRSIDDSKIFLESNIIGVQTLLDACKKYGIKRFHQVSTDEVYGDLPTNSKQKFNENSPLRPSNPYSASKAAADLLVLAYFRTFGLPVTISRSSNNFGRFQHQEKFVPRIIKNAFLDQSVPIFGKGDNVRDWLFVDDNCCAIDKIVHDGVDGNVYNIGAGNELCNLDIANKILLALHKPKSLISFVSDRLGHDRRYGLDTQKIQSELCWHPKFDFDESLSETIDWYIKNLTPKI